MHITGGKNSGQNSARGVIWKHSSVCRPFYLGFLCQMCDRGFFFLSPVSHFLSCLKVCFSEMIFLTAPCRTQKLSKGVTGTLLFSCFSDQQHVLDEDAALAAAFTEKS